MMVQQLPKVLVTGGAGYIGSHIVDLLVKRGYAPVVFDNLELGHREAVHPDAQWIEGSLLNPAQIETAFLRYPIAGVIHMASYALVGESMQQPWKYLRNNYDSAANLLQACMAHGVKRFIFSSTCNLFGNVDVLPIGPDTPPNPASPYGESKLMVEKLLHWMEVIHGLRYCALRYFNAAGAHTEGHLGEDHTPETHLIPTIFEVALGKRDHLKLFGNDYPTADGTCIRDYIHVTDLAEAHIAAFECLDGELRRTFNLGSGKGSSILEVVRMVETVTSKSIPIELCPRRAGDPPELVADITLAERDLGWTPKYSSLRQIIETAWAWHSSHPNGYGSL
jgi:UDP-glucose 4-epimerase